MVLCTLLCGLFRQLFREALAGATLWLATAALIQSRLAQL